MDGQLCAEMGPSYFDVPEAGRRLREHNPDCRIIISLRDPVARSFSLYLHHKRKGRLNCSFREAIQKMPRIIDASRYRKHISRWAEMFGMERILVILLEDISSSPALVLERVYDFIGIARVSAPSEAGESVYVASLPHSPALARLATNGAGWLRDKGLHGLVEFAKGLGLNRVYTGFRGALPALKPEMRRELVREFEPDIAYVEELLGRPLTEWRDVSYAGRKSDRIEANGS